MFYCAVCGARFDTNDFAKITCSEKCEEELKERMAKNLTRRCVMCGVEFRTARREQFLCSRSCSAERTAAIFNCKLSPRKCRVCGKDFTPKNKFQWTCSKECCQEARSAEWRYRYVDCEVCGKPFQKINGALTYSKECAKVRAKERRSEKRKTIMYKKPEVSISEMSSRARESGMTYGQYMVYLKNKAEGIA